jgi:hypothetical protein
LEVGKGRKIEEHTSLCLDVGWKQKREHIWDGREKGNEYNSTVYCAVWWEKGKWEEGREEMGGRMAGGGSTVDQEYWHPWLMLNEIM